MGTQLVVLVEQTSGQEGVLKRATSIMVADNAVATVVVYSLEAFMSPPVKCYGKPVKKLNRRELRCVPCWPSASVIKIPEKPILSVNFS